VTQVLLVGPQTERSVSVSQYACPLSYMMTILGTDGRIPMYLTTTDCLHHVTVMFDVNNTVSLTAGDL
jgi:hypothetical protein